MERFAESGWMTEKQFMTYMGYKSPQSVGRLLFGLPKINKRYNILDLADVLMEEYKA